MTNRQFFRIILPVFLFLVLFSYGENIYSGDGIAPPLSGDVAPVTGRTVTNPNIPGVSPPPTPPDPTQTGLGAVRDALDAQGLPSSWVDDLMGDPPSVTADPTLGTPSNDNTALYYPVNNTIYLKPGLNLSNMTEGELSTFAHEAFHAWYDMVPGWWELWLSDGQEEGVGGFIEEMVDGNGLVAAVSRAITEDESRGGNGQSTVDALIKTNNFLGGGFFSGGFENDREASRWNILKRLYPAIGQLETYFPSTSNKSSTKKSSKKKKEGDKVSMVIPEWPGVSPVDAPAQTGMGDPMALAYIDFFQGSRVDNVLDASQRTIRPPVMQPGMKSTGCK